MTNKTQPLADHTVELRTGLRMPRAFHDDLFARVQAHVQRLKFGGEYQAKDLVCPRYWASLDTSDHWRAGCCIADWERTGKLPLRYLGCRLCKVRYYERI